MIIMQLSQGELKQMLRSLEEKRIIHNQGWGKFSQWRSKTMVAVLITTGTKRVGSRF